MPDLNELEAARRLLATLEAGRGALLGLASTHLPFARALAVHRSLAEGGADLAAAEEAVTLRADLYFQAWRQAVSGVVPDEVVDAPPPVVAPAPKSKGGKRPARSEPVAAPERIEVPAAMVRPVEPAPEVRPVEPAPEVRSERIEVPASMVRPVESERIEVPASMVRPEEPERIEVPASPPAPEPDLFEEPGDLERSVPRDPVHPTEHERIDVPEDPPSVAVAPVEDWDVPGRVATLEPRTESPLLAEIEAAVAPAAPERTGPVGVRAASVGSLNESPFEPISELDYVDDDPSEVTQVGKGETPPLAPVGTIVPGQGGGHRGVPERQGPELIVDDFNEISELEELDPGEFGHRELGPPEVRDGHVNALPVSARRDDDEELIAQGDAPILPEFQGQGEEMSVSFEPGVALRGAPRLTEDDGEPAPAPAPAPSRDPRAEALLARKAVAEAEAALNRGDLARAVQFYTDALDIEPRDVEAYVGRGRCHLETGDYSSAMSDFQRAEDLSPNDPEAKLAMGDLYYNRKEYKRAIDFYDEAVELDGQHAMAKCKRGLAHYYRKNFRQAFQDLQRAMALDPNIPNIHKYVQMALKKMDGKG